MSKRLNLPIALGFFLIGIFSANVAQAQFTNVYWKPSTGLGGPGTWNSANAFWSTNSDGSGALSSPTTLGTNVIYNFSGTAGLVNETSSFTLAGANWLTTGYTWSSGANRTLTGVDQTSTGTNAVNIGNNANLNITGAGFTFDAMAMTGGAGSTLTLTNAAAATTTVIFGTSAARSGRTNSVNTIISGAGTVVLGSQGNSGFTQAGTIVNNSTGTFVLTNSGSGNISVSGVVSGTGGLTLNNTNTGKISLSAANTYTGGTTINSFIGGEIIFSNATSFGTGTITSSGSGTNFVRSGVDGLNLTNALVINAGNTLRMGGTTGNWSNIVSGPISGAGALLYNPSSSGSMYLTGLTNSFGGGVNVGNGTLYFNKLGSNGENSSLGTSGTITVGVGTTTGGLRWNGTANEISDKTIVLAGTTGGLNLYADGDTNSSLTLNGNINSTGAGAKTLTFAGYKTNTLVLNGLINENGGVNSVVIGLSSSGTVVLGNTNNSFSGAVSIGQSTANQSTVLQTAQIGSNGVNSTLGRNGTINIGSSDKDRMTALRYVGAGETSDKVINLSGTTGGAILEQAGTGNLKFTSAMTATGVGAKAITLQGSTAGTGELVGAISDLGGNVISLNKYGSGDWTLSGNNSYSGLTTVMGAGSLLKLMNTGALSAKTSLTGENSLAAAGTIDFGVGGSYTANSYGTVGTAGNNMYFTNSSGNAVTLTFTNANNYITGSTGGGRTLINSSSNLNLDFDGNIEIGSTATNTTTFRGAGSFNVDKNLLDTGTGGIRTLQKDGEGTLTLRGGTNNFRGSTLVSNGKLDLYGNITASTNIVVSTSNSVSSTSTMRTATATLDVKSGGSLLTNSTTTVYSGGNLIVNGTAGGVVVENNGLLGGSGTNNGVVTLKSGSFLTPGNSPGLLTASGSRWEAGSTYEWEIDSNASLAVAGTQWDLFSVTGALDLSDLSSGAQMNLVLKSLSGFNLTDSSNRSWTIAQAASFTGIATGVTDLTSYFNITSTDFASGTFPSSSFQVVTGTDGSLRTLNLMAIPEPSTGSMFGLGFVGLVVTRLLRRKNS